MPLARHHVSDIALAVARLGADRTAELLGVRLVDLPDLLQGRGEVDPATFDRMRETTAAVRDLARGVATLGAVRTAELLEVSVTELLDLMQGRSEVPSPERLQRLRDASQAARQKVGG